jgi:transcription termination factor Rho
VKTGMETIDLAEFDRKSLEDLHAIARERGVEVEDNIRKQDLIQRILQAHTDSNGQIIAEGVLEILPDGWGFLRRDINLAADGSGDIYVSQTQIKRFGLKTGDTVTGVVRPPKENEKYYGLLRVELVNGMDPEYARHRTHFDDLTPIYPVERIRMETDSKNISARLIDMIAPIGKGQRGLIVSPPKAGKTTLLKTIANSITTNHPEIVLLVLLVDERPECGVAQLDFERAGVGEFEPVARALLGDVGRVDANRHGGGRNRLARQPQQLPHG